MQKYIITSIILLFSLFQSTVHAEEREERIFCIFDIGGASGPIFNAAKDMKIQALDWGPYDLKMVPYTNEGVLTEDFKSGKCDGATLAGIRARTFLKFTGSIDSPGGVLSYEHFKYIYKIITHPKYENKIKNGKYEMIGMAPLGMAYVFVNDRSITSLAKAAGKRVAVLDFDPVQAEIVASVGATPVSSSIVDFSRKFNNGVVDIIAAPGAAYSAFELYRGMEPNGGIVRYPLTILTAQILIHQERFIPEFGRKARTYGGSQFDRIIELVDNELSKIDDKYWIDIPKDEVPGYEAMMQELRLHLRDQDYFDGEMLTIMRKVRCKIDPARAECVNPVE